MQPGPLDRMWSLGRTSLGTRLTRLRAKGWQIAQCALAAGAAWLVAADLFGHDTPFFAPIAAVVSLGTSYGQRLRRVIEVTLGVAIGVFVGDLIVVLLGSYLAIESFFDRNIMELVLRITVVLAILSALVLAVAYLRELFLAGLLALGLLLVIDNLGEVRRRLR